MLREIQKSQLLEFSQKSALAPDTLSTAAKIIEKVRSEGLAALQEFAVGFGDVEQGAELFYDRQQLTAALDSISLQDRELLERTAARIESFAEAQLACLTDLSIKIPGGSAGHRVQPIESVGCYVPGGRFPLPSTALMTALTARVAGVKSVWVASPKPQPITLAAAALAGADGLLATGGAQAVAAFAFGVSPLPRMQLIVGPGNRWVTAAKKLLYGEVGIDMLAGPTELLIIADSDADAELVAADLLAQAEHDPDARPMLISFSKQVVAAVNLELKTQLENLPARDIAAEALRNGFALCVDTLAEAAELANVIAPEHLQLHIADCAEIEPLLRNYGALFMGENTAEVLGDYGIGPNHVLPTEGTAQFSSGLSVFNFLQVRSFVNVDDKIAASEAIADAVALAEVEGLEAHARAARLRST